MYGGTMAAFGLLIAMFSKPLVNALRAMLRPQTSLVVDYSEPGFAWMRALAIIIGLAMLFVGASIIAFGF